MWEAILWGVFEIIQFFYGFCQDWGLAIVIITILFRLAITPLMFSQTKSSYNMQKIQPRIKEIQERFAGDQIRINEETQKMYAEAKFNPLAGCVPMLIQMPIFIALFNVLRDMDKYIAQTGVSTETYCFYNIVPDLVKTPAEAFGQGVGVFLPYIILLLIFALATFVPMLLMQMKQGDSSQRKQTIIMSSMMSLMMLWIGWSSPAGVLLFWGASSLIAIAQQQISMRILKKQDAEKEAAKAAAGPAPVQVNVTRKTQKKRQSKKH